MSAPPRLIALDVLRGVAVMGIVLMNISGFGLPQAAYLNPAAFGGASGADLAVWAIGFVLIDGKMRALFSLLFGAGMVLAIDRAEAGGQDGIVQHLRRMAVLLGFGAIHAYLIWAGDILIPYAMVGTLAAAHVRRPSSSLLVIAAVLLLCQWLLLWMLVGGLATLRDAAVAPGAGAAAIQAWRAVADQIGIPSLIAIGRELAIFQGDYPGIVADRFRHASTPVLQLIDVGPETLALMLLGMAGVRSGFLLGEWSAITYRRIAIAAYGVGLTSLTMIAAATIRTGFDEFTTVQAATLFAAPFRIIVMVGHVAVLLLWVKQSPGGWLLTRTAAVGQVAFSNYLATSLVMTTLFYGYGLELFGQLSRAQLWLLVMPTWIAMLAWSHPWLSRFRYGPLEWLWRAIARWQRPPMRRHANGIES